MFERAHSIGIRLVQSLQDRFASAPRAAGFAVVFLSGTGLVFGFAAAIVRSLILPFGVARDLTVDFTVE
jgi:hypothetical protein